MTAQDNILSIGVEDYSHVTAFAGVVDGSRWDTHICLVEANTRRLLDLPTEKKTRATFFILGWVAVL